MSRVVCWLYLLRLFSLNELLVGGSYRRALYSGYLWHFFTLSVDNRIEITSTSSGGKKDSIILLKNWLIMQQYAGTRYKLTFYEHRLKKNLSCKRATINLIKFPHFYWILTSCWLSVTYSPCSLSHRFLLNRKYDITDKCLDTFILHSNLICT